MDRIAIFSLSSYTDILSKRAVQRMMLIRTYRIENTAGDWEVAWRRLRSAGINCREDWRCDCACENDVYAERDWESGSGSVRERRRGHNDHHHRRTDPDRSAHLQVKEELKDFYLQRRE